MMRVAAVALLLAGCATSKPGVRVETVTVKVPVSCLSRTDLPVKPAPLPPRPSNDARPLLDLSLAKLVELMGPELDGRGGYVGKADALLRGCAGR